MLLSLKASKYKRLTVSDPNGIVYIKTDQLDGETDLKPRTVLDLFSQTELSDIDKYEFIYNIKKNKLDEFEGKVREIVSEIGETKGMSRKQHSLEDGNIF